MSGLNRKKPNKPAGKGLKGGKGLKSPKGAKLSKKPKPPAPEPEGLPTLSDGSKTTPIEGTIIVSGDKSKITICLERPGNNAGVPQDYGQEQPPSITEPTNKCQELVIAKQCCPPQVLDAPVAPCNQACTKSVACGTSPVNPTPEGPEPKPEPRPPSGCPSRFSTPPNTIYQSSHTIPFSSLVSTGSSRDRGWPEFSGVYCGGSSSRSVGICGTPPCYSRNCNSSQFCPDTSSKTPSYRVSSGSRCSSRCSTTIRCHPRPTCSGIQAEVIPEVKEEVLEEKLTEVEPEAAVKPETPPRKTPMGTPIPTPQPTPPKSATPSAASIPAIPQSTDPTPISSPPPPPLPPSSNKPSPLPSPKPAATSPPTPQPQTPPPPASPLPPGTPQPPASPLPPGTPPALPAPPIEEESAEEAPPSPQPQAQPGYPPPAPPPSLCYSSFRTLSPPSCSLISTHSSVSYRPRTTSNIPRPSCCYQPYTSYPFSDTSQYNHGTLSCHRNRDSGFCFSRSSYDRAPSADPNPTQEPMSILKKWKSQLS